MMRRNDPFGNACALITVLCLLVMVFGLSGCADYEGINRAILENNRLMRQAYADGMAGCREDAACKVGVTAAYFSGAGQQQVLKPPDGVDYMRAGLPYAQIALQVFGLFYNGSGGPSYGDRSGVGIYANGDGNVFNIGNRLSADNYSLASMDLGASYSRTWDGYNRNFNSGGTGELLTDAGITAEAM